LKGAPSWSKRSRNTNGFRISPKSDGLIKRVTGPCVRPRVRCTIARALLGGGDLVGSRAIGVPLKIAWELGPSPRSGGQDALARAVSEVLKKEPQDTASHEALSRHATKAASRRKPSLRSAAAKKAAVTKGVMLRRFAQSGANAQASHNSVASWEQPCRRSALEHKQDGAEFDGASGDFTVC